MAGLYFEEFYVDQKFEHPWGRTITESDNMMFSCLTLNVQPLHIDADFASRTEWGKPLVNSLFTLGTTVANLGMTDIRFPKPLFHGDTIRVRTSVKSVRESKSRPKAGIVEFEHVAVNQHKEVVAICVRQALMHKRSVLDTVQ